MERRKAVKSRLLSGNSGFRWIFVDDSTDANDPKRLFGLFVPLAEQRLTVVNRLGRIHSFGLEHGGAGRAGQELDQRFSRYGILARGSDADRKDHLTVQITGQRADYLSPRNSGNFRGLSHVPFRLRPWLRARPLGHLAPGRFWISFDQ
jgi:hypothetical protein